MSAPQLRRAGFHRLLLAVLVLGLVGILLESEELLPLTSTAISAAHGETSATSVKAVSSSPPLQNDQAPEPMDEANETEPTDEVDKTKQMEQPQTTEPVVTKDPLFAVKGLPETGAPWHHEDYITRSASFDMAISREKGIIIALLDRAFAMGLSLVKELRCLGNDELIQVYYCTDLDLSLQSRQLLVAQDNKLETIDVCSDMVRAKQFSLQIALKFKSWWVKPLAIYHTNLKHPLLLDADDLLLKDPAAVRQTPSYNSTGALFFYDRVAQCPYFLNNHLKKKQNVRYLDYILQGFPHTAFGFNSSAPSSQLVNSFAYQNKTCHEQDSSMVAIDKSRQGKAMEVLWWLITELRFRMDFSWGDKESFWLSYELGQQPYSFSPWGVSVISSAANKDMIKHPETLCGSIAQYVPDHETEPELFYVNGRALLDPLAQGADNQKATPNIMYNANPTHVVPRMTRRAPNVTIAPPTTKPSKGKKKEKDLPPECLVGFGSTPLPVHFATSLYRRRLHVLGINSGILEHLQECNPNL